MDMGFSIDSLIECQVWKLEPLHLFLFPLQDHTGADCIHAEKGTLEVKGSQKWAPILFFPQLPYF